MNISSAFPKEELISVIELINEMSRCVTREGAESLLTRTKELLMADCAVCGTGRIDEKGDITLSNIVDSGYPAEWLNLYFKEGLYLVDPVLQHHMRFSEPELWSNIKKGVINEKARAVTEWADGYGLKYGISSSVYIPGTGMFSLFCFASNEDIFTERHKNLLSALTLHLNMAITEGSGENSSERNKSTGKGPFVQ